MSIKDGEIFRRITVNRMAHILRGGNWDRNPICEISGILEEVEDDELPERWVRIINREVTWGINEVIGDLNV